MSKRRMPKFARLLKPFVFSTLEIQKELLSEIPEALDKYDPETSRCMLESLDYGIEHANQALNLAAVAIRELLRFVPADTALDRERFVSSMRGALQHAFMAGKVSESYHVFEMIDCLPDGEARKALECYRKILAGSEKAHGSPEDRQRKASEIARAIEKVMQDDPKLKKSGAVLVVAKQFDVDPRTVYRHLEAAAQGGTDNPDLSAD